MATNPSRLRVTELDFDDIKDNLKTFLRAQNTFKDYDFEGSGMNILLDTLAYNTHYLAYNANMVANEMFLDSAQIRNNIVSRAKMLGYTPRSAQGASATIQLNVIPSTSVDSLTVAKNTSFTSTISTCGQRIT